MFKSPQKQAQSAGKLDTAPPKKEKLVTPIHKFTSDSKVFNEFFFAYCSDTKQKQVTQKERQKFQKMIIRSCLDADRLSGSLNKSKPHSDEGFSSRVSTSSSRVRTSSRGTSRLTSRDDTRSGRKDEVLEDPSDENNDHPPPGSIITIHSSRLGKQSAIILSKILSTAEYGPIIRGLDLHENVIRDDGCIALCQTWLKGEHARNNVYKIDFGSNDISPRGLTPLLDYIIDVEASSNLRELRLGSGANDICVNKMDAKSAILLAKGLAMNQAIRILDLNRNVGIGKQSQKAFKSLADSFKKNQQFEEIRLGEVEMSTHSAIAILESLQNHEHLSILDLHGNGLTYEIAKPLRRIIVPHRYQNSKEEVTQEVSAVLQIESLEEDFDPSSPRKNDVVYMNDFIGMPFENDEDNDSDSDDELLDGEVQSSKLSVLRLEKNRIGTKGISILYPALRKNFSLRELNLMGNSIGDEGARFIAEYLKENNSLEILDLQDNQIGGTGVIDIASALSSNYTLRSLNLSKNKCGDPGVAALGLILKTNNSLEHINLALTGCDDAGALALFQSLAVNYTLKTLNMSSNHLTDDSGVALEQTLKKAAENLKQKRKKSGIKSIILTGNQIDHTTLLRVKKIISKNISSLQSQEPSKLQNELIRLTYITDLLKEAKKKYTKCFDERRQVEAELRSAGDSIQQTKMRFEVDVREFIANIEIEKATIFDNENKIEGKRVEMEKTEQLFEKQQADLEETLQICQKKRKVLQDEFDIISKEYEEYSERPEDIVQSMKDSIQSNTSESDALEKTKQKNAATISKLLSDIENLKKKLKQAEITEAESRYEKELALQKEEEERARRESEEMDKPQDSFDAPPTDDVNKSENAPSLIANVEAEITQVLNENESRVAENIDPNGEGKEESHSPQSNNPLEQSTAEEFVSQESKPDTLSESQELGEDDLHDDMPHGEDA